MIFTSTLLTRWSLNIMGKLIGVSQRFWIAGLNRVQCLMHRNIIHLKTKNALKKTFQLILFARDSTKLEAGFTLLRVFGDGIV
ncbi:MAG: hypothetical protein CM1200mP30_05080 [Pseudomonadota bacterium]|nr:MAG: hypothetical protein CM1200mP30_05080 [Pseudomonadota bacterium]